MRSYFDASALVAAMVEEEEHHPIALKALANSTEGFTSTHALAETFATLTSGRLEIQLSPDEAARIIDVNIVQRLQVLDLSLADYRQVMKVCQTVGARGGAIFDMLHLQAARRGRAQRILTINIHHFRTFAPDLRDIISLP